MHHDGFGTGVLRAALFCALAGAAPAQAQDGAALMARYEAVREALGSSQFQRPLHLESREKSGDLQGDVYALVAQPFGAAGPALRGVEQWCDILILLLNVKRCRAGATGDTLAIDIGRKFDQPLADTYAFEFAYAVGLQPDYLRVELSTAAGPMGTSRYRIVFEMVPLDPANSFLHVSYAYAQGTAARWATKFYLATVGHAKVGFSVVGRRAGGQPIYVRSTRGVIERNAMRFYLAIEAYLGALSAPAVEQSERRLNDWFAAAERYPRQLHELERDAYLQMKRMEILRQQGTASAVRASP